MPEFNSEQRAWLRWGLNSVLIVAFAVIVMVFGLPFEVNVELPPTPSPIAPTDDDVAYGFQTKVYLTDGGDRLQVASGGEIDVASGGTLDVNGNISSGTGAVTVTDSLAVTGTADFASTLQFGTDNLYPLGYASNGYQWVCGTTGTFTATSAVAVSGLTTVTHVIALQITDPASTAAIISVDAPTTSTVTFNSWTVSPTVSAGTTGVNLFYCALGNQ